MPFPSFYTPSCFYIFIFIWIKTCPNRFTSFLTCASSMPSSIISTDLCSSEDFSCTRPASSSLFKHLMVSIRLCSMMLWSLFSASRPWITILVLEMICSCVSLSSFSSQQNTMADMLSLGQFKENRVTCSQNIMSLYHKLRLQYVLQFNNINVLMQKNF